MLPFIKLDFDEEKHVYFVDGKPLKASVSKLIKQFYKPFPSKQKAEEIEKGMKTTGAVGKYSGMSSKKILKQWKKINEESTTRGTRVHEFGEVYPFNRRLKPRCKQEEAIVKFWEDLPNYLIPVTMELRMYHFELMFGGTADILLYNTLNNTFVIADYKTNKDLFKNYQGQTMTGIFKDKLDMPYSHYEIQLSYYQIMLEQIKKVKITQRIIVYLKLDGSYKMYQPEDVTTKLRIHHNV